MSPDSAALVLSLLATAVACGLSLYAALAVPGILAHAGWVVLPASLSGLAGPPVWGGLLFLLAVELAASRFRLSDLIWSGAHVIARPAAALLLVSAGLAGAPSATQWLAALAAFTLALCAHMAIAGLRTASRTAGPLKSSRVLGTAALGSAVLLPALAWTAPQAGAALAAILLLAQLPLAPRLWGAALLTMRAIIAALVHADRLRAWDVGPEHLPGSVRRLAASRLGEALRSARSARITLARRGRGWPYTHGRLLIAAEADPAFVHRRGFRARLIALPRGVGRADHGVLVESVEVEAGEGYMLCVGAGSPGGPAILAALRGSGGAAGGSGAGRPV